MSEAELTPEELSTLEERARGLAAIPSAGPQAELGVEVVVVRSGRDRYGLPGDAVRAVGPITQLTPLPHAPPHVAGLTTFRGGIVVVFYLHAVLGAPTSVSEHGRMVILDESCAVAVDSVERVERVVREALRPPPEGLSAAVGRLVEGVTESGVALVRIDALLASERMFVDIETVGVATFFGSS